MATQCLLINVHVAISEGQLQAGLVYERRARRVVYTLATYHLKYSHLHPIKRYSEGTSTLGRERVGSGTV
jgi:hypothetical protein